MPYWNIRDERSVIDGVVYRGTQAIIPSSMHHILGFKIHSVVHGYCVLACNAGKDTCSSCGTCAMFSCVNTCESMLTQPVFEYHW